MFFDQRKSEQVCGLINIIGPKLLMDKNYVRLVMTHAPPSDGGIPKRIETPEGLPSKAGWHEDESGRPFVLSRKPSSSARPN